MKAPLSGIQELLLEEVVSTDPIEDTEREIQLCYFLVPKASDPFWICIYCMLTVQSFLLTHINTVTRLGSDKRFITIDLKDVYFSLAVKP